MMHTPAPRSLSSSRGPLLAASLSLALASCSGGSAGDPENRGDFEVATISTGRGTIYPYRIRAVDSFGNPTSQVLNIGDIDTLKANVNGNNGVLPVAALGTSAELPDGNPGNQFLQFDFTHSLDVESILSPLLSNQSNAGLTGALNVLGYDPATEATNTLRGRGFVNGYTYFNEAGVLKRKQAVEADGEFVRILDGRAAGFPNYQGAAALVSKKTFVFIADADNDLTTFDTFPADKLIRLVVTNAVRDSENDPLEQEVSTATTVGDDTNPPQVIGYTSIPEITPGNGQTGVDPTTQILIRFNKPVQPGDVGAFFDPAQFSPPSGGLTLSVTAAAQTFAINYFADPLSYADLCNYRITPSYNLPGQSTVSVQVQNTTIRSLNQVLVGAAVTTDFSTSDGPGIVNAPVAPEALYFGIGGAVPGVAVLDLNGFGQGTGDINNTRFPLNPNIGQPAVSPPLAPGSSNLDAGSGGALTLVRDTSLNTLLLREPLVGDVPDIHVGAPLDLVFNNENINVNATRANQQNPLLFTQMAGNSISQPPHPNPPRLVFPPPNPNRAIFGEEPTTTSSSGSGTTVITTNPPCVLSPINLLVQGNPFGTTQGSVGVFGTIAQGTFVGPQPPPTQPPPPPPNCPFVVRQQVGNFLYVLDRDNRQILVLNSNRFTVLDSIRLSDPVSMAMSPSMNRLAVSNFASSSVSFIDINPLSASFHQVVAETRVGRGPTGISWQPDGEDVLVVSTGANLLTVISASDFNVRRTVTGFLNGPIEVAVTERFVTTGYLQGVYYAYVLNGNGTVAVYESGPDGVNGIGFNDMIGTIPNFTFTRPRSISFDYGSFDGSVLIGHVDASGLGQVSRLDLNSSPVGPQPLSQNNAGFILPPTYRQKEWTVGARFGGLNLTNPRADLLSGNSVVDVALDDMTNAGAYQGQVTQFSTGYENTPWRHSGKHKLKSIPPVPTIVPVINPKLMFVGLSDVGKVDVFDYSTGRRLASIPVPGIRCVSSYWRQ